MRNIRPFAFSVRDRITCPGASRGALSRGQHRRARTGSSGRASRRPRVPHGRLSQRWKRHHARAHDQTQGQPAEPAALGGATSISFLTHETGCSKALLHHTTFEPFPNVTVGSSRQRNKKAALGRARLSCGSLSLAGLVVCWTHRIPKSSLQPLLALNSKEKVASPLRASGGCRTSPSSAVTTHC